MAARTTAAGSALNAKRVLDSSAKTMPRPEPSVAAAPARKVPVPSHAVSKAKEPMKEQVMKAANAATAVKQKKIVQKKKVVRDQGIEQTIVRSRQTAAAEARQRAMSGSALSAEQYSVIMRDLQGRDITPEDYDLLLRLDEAVPKKNVLSKEAASAAVQQLTQVARADDASECSICVEQYEEGEQVATLCCGHTYHPACIHNWLTTGKATCPMCGAQQCCMP